MLLPQTLLSSSLILAAVAQHGTSTPASSTAATSTASPGVTLTPEAGRIPLFPYEEEQWSEEMLEELPLSQSRLFAFDSANYTLDSAKGDHLNNGSNHLGNSSQGRCKVYPGDLAWPKSDEWAQLNSTLGGALLTGVPAASVCYSNGTREADGASCSNLAANWTNSYTHLDDPIEMFSPVYQGLTCQPKSLYDSGGCTRGGYPIYTVNVSTTAQLQIAINFARNTGVRFVIKNTGHDFSGKSGGAGSLSVWVHNLKDIAYIPSYNDATTD